MLESLHHERHPKLQTISIPSHLNAAFDATGDRSTEQFCRLYESADSVSTEINNLEQLNIVLHENNKYCDLRLSFHQYQMAAFQTLDRMPTIENISVLSSLSIFHCSRLAELISDVKTSELSNLKKLELQRCSNLAPFLDHVGFQLEKLIVSTPDIAAVSSFLASTEARLTVLSLNCLFRQDDMESIRSALLSRVPRFKETLQWLYLDETNLDTQTHVPWRWNTFHALDLPSFHLRGLGLGIGKERGDFHVSTIYSSFTPNT